MITIDYFYLSTPQRTYKTQTDPVLIGRASGDHPVDLDLNPDSTVSRRHAYLSYENNDYWLEDLGSRSGTWLNNHEITEKTCLVSGDQIKVGQTNLIVRIYVASSQTDDLVDTHPLLPLEPEDDDPFESGILTTTVNATQSPTKLILTQKSGEAAFNAMQRRLTALYELGAALSTVETVEPLLKTVIEHLRKVIVGAQRGALLLRDGHTLIVKAYRPEGIQPSISLYLARLAIEKQEAFTWRFDDPGDMKSLTDSIVSHGTRCAMYAPLIWQEEVLGIVYVDNFVAEDAFTDDDLRLLTAMASQAAMFVKNHALQEDLRHQEIIRSNLLRQFSPQVAEHLEGLLKESGQLGLGGERAEPVTILNSDVRGFTAISAEMDPTDVMEMLNKLFGVCTPIIFKYKGTVDKYIGDGILAVFGSPNPDPSGLQWENAMRAALEMQQAVRRLNRHWQSLGRPTFEIGIGIHTGAVLQGFIGAEERMQYTVIGDTVNRASRYCDGAGEGQVVISPDVYEHVSHLVEVSSKTVKTKHPKTESDLEAYIVEGFTTQSMNLP
jgi:adenylate cyclase